MTSQHSRRLLAALALPAAAAFVLAGCAGGDTSAPSDSESAGSASGDGRLSVVASTDVYGSIVEAIAGDKADVTSLIVGTAQDPHEYTATSQDQLAVSKADLLVRNGAGYDDFVDTLKGDADTPEVTAEDTTGLTEEGMGAEHFWYSLPGIEDFASAVADELGTLDPANKSAFDSGLAAFTSSVDGLISDASSVTDCGDILMTEPVPGYLLEAAGCTDVTPASFAEAIEEGTGVSVADLQEVLDLIKGGTLSFLALNTQTEGAEAEQIIDAANSGNVPIVKFSETLPDGDDYLSWMADNVAAVKAALQ